MHGPDPVSSRKLDLGREGDGPVEHGLAGSKQRAEQEPEGEKANVYQCTDELGCPAADSLIMELARKIIKQADIESKGDEAVGCRDIKAHLGPIIHAKEVTSKEKQ